MQKASGDAGVSASAPIYDSDASWNTAQGVRGPDIPDTRVNAVNLREMGVFGTPIFGGLITEDFNTKFADLKSGLKIYDEMRRTDGTVQATLLGMELPILQAEWFIEPASQDPMDIKIANLVGWNLFEGMTTSFKDVLRQALGMHWAGFSLFEKVFEPKEYEGEYFIGLRKIAQRLQTTVNRWDFDEAGGCRGVFQLAPTSVREVFIPIWKCLLFTNRKEGGNVQGMSFLRPSYKHWYMKDKLYRLQAIGVERDVVGVPVIQLPTASGRADREKAEQIVKSLRRDENAGVVIKNTWELKLLQGLNTGGKETSLMEMIRHHDMKIAQSMLAQMINLGEGSRGAYALAVPMADLMTMSQMAQADYVTEVFNYYLIRQLVQLNWPGRKAPKLAHGDIRKKDLRQLSLIFNALMTAGLLEASPEVLAYVRHVFGLPERDSAFDLPPATPADPTAAVPENRPTSTAPQPNDSINSPDALVKELARDGGRDEFVYNDALAAVRAAEDILAARAGEAAIAASAFNSFGDDERFGNGFFNGESIG